MVNVCYVYFTTIKKKEKRQVVYLHIQIIIILQMNYFLNISICYIWKSRFLERNKNIYISSTRMVSNCNKNQMQKVYKMTPD